jgi:MraZ protein
MQLMAETAEAPVLTTRPDALVLYPHEEWDITEEHLENQPPLDPDAEDISRYLISGWSEAPIDKQGRILVPGPLREHAGLDREVVVAGVGRVVELWNKTRFEEALRHIQENYRQRLKALTSNLEVRGVTGVRGSEETDSSE